MTTLENRLLDLLEKLLQATEEDARESFFWREWQEVSAEVADIRAGDLCRECGGEVEHFPGCSEAA